MPTTTRMIAYLAMAAILILIGASFRAEAHDALAWSDPERDAWFRSLKMPGSNASCCSLKDCDVTDARQEADGSWSALVAGEWLAVPPDKVLASPLSIDGSAYICASQYSGTVLCFIPPIPGF